jgi:hypothetical protein
VSGAGAGAGAGARAGARRQGGGETRGTRRSDLTLRLFAQLFVGVILANTQKAQPKQRKVIEVGLIKLLSRSDAMLALDKVW